MTKSFRIQENIYSTYLKLKNRKKQQQFLEKCFIFAWENREIETDYDVELAFCGVKPSIKLSENGGGLNNPKGINGTNSLKNKEVDKSDSGQGEVRVRSDSGQTFISNKNKDISNKEEKEIKKEKEYPNNLEDNAEDRNNPKWTDRDRWEKGWVDRTKYIICYKGIVPKDWKPTMEDYEKSGGYPYYYDNLPRRYRFEGKIIKLDEKDYNKWKKEFNKLDLENELCGLDNWALENFKDDKSKLFWTIRGILTKTQKEKIKNNPNLDKYWL